jgi:hypothetical protein
MVAPGRYREQVRLEEGVTLLSVVPGAAVLVPPAETSGAPAAVVVEGLRSGRVSGFTIEGSGATPLDFGVVIRTSGATVEDLEIRHARVAGIAVEGPGAVTIMACRIHDNAGAGIVVRGAATPRILHNLVIDNGHAAGGPGPGIALEGGARPTIAGNIVTGNAAEGVRGALGPTRPGILEANVFSAFGRTNGRTAVSVVPASFSRAPVSARKPS